MVSVVFELFLVGFGLAAMAEIVRSPLITVASGLWFLTHTVALAFAGSPLPLVSQTFFALIGVVLIYVGSWRLYKNYKSTPQFTRQPLE